MQDAYRRQEMRLTPVLARMELAGFLFHSETMYEQRKAMHRKKRALEEVGWRLAGREFNWSSAKDVGAVLFDQVRAAGSGCRVAAAQAAAQAAA